MKNNLLTHLFLLLSLLVFIGCGKDSSNTPEPVELPKFDETTAANQSYVKEITAAGGNSGGTSKNVEIVSVLSGKTGICADQHGHVWSTTQTEPTLENQEGKSQNGKYCGDTLLTFESRLTNLAPEKIYYVRPYATYGASSIYGKVLQVRVNAKPPVFPPKLYMPEIPTITANALTIKVYLEGAGDGDIQQHGFVYLEGTANELFVPGVDMTDEDLKFVYAEPSLNYKLIKLGPLSVAGPGSVISATITGLKPKHNYKVWAFASNAGGAAFSAVPYMFRTL